MAAPTAVSRQTSSTGVQKDIWPSTIAAQGLNDKAAGQQSPSQLARVYGDVSGAMTKRDAISAVWRSRILSRVAATPIAAHRDCRVLQWATDDDEATTSSGDPMAKYPAAEELDVARMSPPLSARRTSTATARTVERCSNRIVNPQSLPPRTTAFAADTDNSAFPNQFVCWIKTTIRSLPAGRRKYLRACALRTLDRTNTDTLTVGASRQATNDAKIWDHETASPSAKHRP